VRQNKLPRYLSPKEVSDTYGFPEGTLANMRSRRVGPPFVKMRRKVLYPVDLLETWLDQHRVITREE
jgi:hypothetical protein